MKRLTPLSPNLQAHVERVIQPIKNEVLNAFCIVSYRNMDHILRTAMHWYNERRGHPARNHLPPVLDEDPPMHLEFPNTPGSLVIRSWVGFSSPIAKWHSGRTNALFSQNKLPIRFRTEI